MSNIIIYTKALCPFCVRAKSLLKGKAVDFDEIDITFNSSRRAEMIERAQGASTVPQIFIGTQHIGGCDDLYALEEAGALDGVLAEYAPPSR